jgi:hypothetical protein
MVVYLRYAIIALGIVVLALGFMFCGEGVCDYCGHATCVGSDRVDRFRAVIESALAAAGESLLRPSFAVLYGVRLVAAPVALTPATLLVNEVSPLRI